MKNIETKWTADGLRNAKARRGPAVGIAAVLVSEKLGSSYSAVVSSLGEDPVESLLKRLPPCIGVYAAIASSNPEWLESQSNFPWKDDVLGKPPYTAVEDGIAFHKTIPDNSLADLRLHAWERLAEEVHVAIVERWGLRATP